MPSITVVWKGKCRDTNARYRLLGYLHRLALVSDEYLRLRQPDRPHILKAMGERRGSEVRRRANIESVDPDVIATGNIGCIAQIASGTAIPVLHPVELIDWATGGPVPEQLKSRVD